MKVSLQELLREGLDQARELHEVAIQSGAEPSSFSDFCARHLVQILAPVMTEIQKHIESCPVSFELPNDPTPVANVQGTVTVDGQALPPFYTRATQEEFSSGGAL